MNTYFILYLLSIIDDVDMVIKNLAVAGLFILVILVATSLIFSASDDDYSFSQYIERFKVKSICFITTLLILLHVLIPTKEDLTLILGIGTTVEYIKENPNVQQLPDSTAQALNSWLEYIVLSTKEQ